MRRGTETLAKGFRGAAEIGMARVGTTVVFRHPTRASIQSLTMDMRDSGQQVIAADATGGGYKSYRDTTFARGHDLQLAMAYTHTSPVTSAYFERHSDGLAAVRLAGAASQTGLTVFQPLATMPRTLARFVGYAVTAEGPTSNEIAFYYIDTPTISIATITDDDFRQAPTGTGVQEGYLDLHITRSGNPLPVLTSITSTDAIEASWPSVASINRHIGNALTYTIRLNRPLRSTTRTSTYTIAVANSVPGLRNTASATSNSFTWPIG